MNLTVSLALLCALHPPNMAIYASCYDDVSTKFTIFYYDENLVFEKGYTEQGPGKKQYLGKFLENQNVISVFKSNDIEVWYEKITFENSTLLVPVGAMPDSLFFLELKSKLNEDWYWERLNIANEAQEYEYEILLQLLCDSDLLIRVPQSQVGTFKGLELPTLRKF